MWPNRAFPFPQNKFQFDMERSQTLKRVFECFPDFVYLRNVITLEEGCTEIGLLSCEGDVAGSGYIKNKMEKLSTQVDWCERDTKAPAG